MISHGIASFLKERLFDASDAYRLHVCDLYVDSSSCFVLACADQRLTNRCGLTAIANLVSFSLWLTAYLTEC